MGRVLAVLLVGLCYCLSACSPTPKTSEPQPTSVSNNSTPSFAALAEATPTPIEARASSSNPTVDEIIRTVARVFDQSAEVDQNRAPVFLVGDFNGDGSQDLAVFTKPKDASLPEINNELANWTLEDPHEVPVPGSKGADNLIRPKPVKAERNDSLLAIIHGIGPKGWRNSEARQTFLLRNATSGSLTVQSSASLLSSHLNFPARGDAIAETANGRHGFIFWTGAKYAWAPQSPK